jgi:hypothetical protein
MRMRGVTCFDRKGLYLEMSVGFALGKRYEYRPLGWAPPMGRYEK